jgi:NADPH:quinone reductase-like Zn-dependent oxidoreductase
LCDGPVTDRTVLVAGGTGAVGYYAVRSPSTTARASSRPWEAPEGRIARDAGADEVIDFQADDVGIADCGADERQRCTTGCSSRTLRNAPC